MTQSDDEHALADLTELLGSKKKLSAASTKEVLLTLLASQKKARVIRSRQTRAFLLTSLCCVQEQARAYKAAASSGKKVRKVSWRLFLVASHRHTLLVGYDQGFGGLCDQETPPAGRDAVVPPKGNPTRRNSDFSLLFHLIPIGYHMILHE
jgi:hypothetical protein